MNLDLTVNEYTFCDSYSMVKLVGHPMTWLFDLCTDQFEIFSRFLAKAEVDFWCIQAWDKKNTRDGYNPEILATAKRGCNSLCCDSYYCKLWHSHLENCSCVVLFIETIHQLGSTVLWQTRVKTLIVFEFNTFAVQWYVSVYVWLTLFK